MRSGSRGHQNPSRPTKATRTPSTWSSRPLRSSFDRLMNPQGIRVDRLADGQQVLDLRADRLAVRSSQVGQSQGPDVGVHVAAGLRHVGNIQGRSDAVALIDSEHVALDGLEYALV